MDGVVPGDGVAVGQKFALQPAADQHSVPSLEQNVAGSLVYRNRSLSRTDLFHLAQSGAGHHEGEGLSPLDFFHSLPAQCQAVAIHRHHGESALIHFKEGTGVDGAAFIIADGEQCLGDHGAQRALLHGKGVLLVHGRQLRKFLRVCSQDVELRQTTFDVHHIVVCGKDYHVIRHFPDDLAEQAGREHQGTGLLDLCGYGGLDPGFQVIAGKTEAGVRLD